MAQTSKKIRHSGTRYSAAVREKARRLYEEGCGIPEICKRLGPTPKVLRGWLLKMGVQLRGQARQYDRKAILISIKKVGVTEAARQHGCSVRFASDLNTGRLRP